MEQSSEKKFIEKKIIIKIEKQYSNYLTYIFQFAQNIAIVENTTENGIVNLYFCADVEFEVHAILSKINKNFFTIKILNKITL